METEEADDGLAFLGEKLSGVLPEGVAENMATILESVRSSASVDFDLVFDPTLVRGMSYYTGSIFEIKMPELSGCLLYTSCGGLSLLAGMRRSCRESTKHTGRFAAAGDLNPIMWPGPENQATRWCWPVIMGRLSLWPKR